MAGLSQRLVRLALLASATSLLGYQRPALAQMPIQAAPQPVPPPPAAAPATAPPVSAEPLPPAPSPPPGARPPPASADVPAPDKAAVITEPNARRDAESKVEADAERDEAYDAAVAVSPRSRWYGWQTLTSDGASLTFLVVGASTSSGRDDFGNALAWFGVLGYEFAPGIIHFTHRNPGRGLGSFGLRLGMPLAGAFVGLAMASGCDGFLCEVSGAATGVLLGMAGAVVIDAAVFAYDDRRRAPARGVKLVPLLNVGHGQAWVGVGGTL